MAKSTTPPPRKAGSRRAAPTKVSKPFPWGTVAGSAVLAVALIGIVAYAAVNQGSGVDGVISAPDKNIKGVVVDGNLAAVPRNHVEGPVKYPQTPPNDGDHNAVAQTCAVYSSPIAPEHAVHSLEHGAVWITYSKSVSDSDVQDLARQVNGNPYRMLSPIPDQTAPIDLSAWGRRLSVDKASDGRVGDFLKAYTNGPQTPERGSACIGTSATGPVEAAAPGATVQPPGSSPAADQPAPDLQDGTTAPTAAP